ncbi:unnamed protein product [Echinostoma caproni]|uniref:Charged multivesicular body protein 2b n=1 Tax=Echinostoma caproni TaxID=27848 RepID=A0A183BAH7_9TREM|nr:unnamed protein product [Echinostoma caproni]
MSKDKRSRDMVHAIDKDVRSGKREMNRSQMELQRQEKSLISEIKKYAHQGDKAMCARLAQQLISVRKHMAQNTQMSVQMSQVGCQARMCAAQQRLVNISANTSKTLAAVNKVSTLMQNALFLMYL